MTTTVSAPISNPSTTASKEDAKKEELKKKGPWLHAWRTCSCVFIFVFSTNNKQTTQTNKTVDPVANLHAFSQCVRVADLNADGEYRLLVADADSLLKIFKGVCCLLCCLLLLFCVCCCLDRLVVYCWSCCFICVVLCCLFLLVLCSCPCIHNKTTNTTTGQQLVSETAIVGAPVALATFYSDVSKPQTPCGLFDILCFMFCVCVVCVFLGVAVVCFGLISCLFVCSCCGCGFVHIYLSQHASIPQIRASARGHRATGAGCMGCFSRRKTRLQTGLSSLSCFLLCSIVFGCGCCLACVFVALLLWLCLSVFVVLCVCVFNKANAQNRQKSRVIGLCTVVF